MKKLYVELANTPLKREQGLMGRKKLAHNHGMLFDFKSPRRLSFWMSNTYIPLDIAFINEDGRITEIREMVPLSTRTISSKDSCKYALEVNRGWFGKNGIQAGALIQGTGIKTSTTKTAQMTQQQQPIGVPPLAEGEDPLAGMPTEEMAPPEEPQAPDPDIMLNKSFKDIIDDAQSQGKNLIVIYETKDGFLLPPKQISPPYIFEEDADGRANAIVKAWDNQGTIGGENSGPGWKSFLIDNIIDLEVEAEPEMVENTAPKENKEIVTI